MILDVTTRRDFEQAYELYRMNPTLENGRTLLRYVADWLSERQLSSIGPSLAIIDVLNERGHFKKRLFARFVQRKVLPLILRCALTETRPGWNDYWMCRWELTKEPRAAEEIHRRVFHLIGPKWEMVRLSANWMAGSQGRLNFEFAEAMKTANNLCHLPHPAVMLSSAENFDVVRYIGTGLKV
jgi:hypothetical protein